MRIGVLGGGLSGLSTAYHLVKSDKFKTVTILEATSRLGGWIASHRNKDGVIFEQGPRTISIKNVNDYSTLDLVNDLGIAKEIVPISANHPIYDNKPLLYVGGTLHTVSLNKWLFFKQAPFSRGLIFAMLQDLRTPPKQVDDESTYDFVRRRFGVDIADCIASPLIAGVCGGDAKQISVKFLLKTMFDYEQNYGGVIKGLVKSRTKNRQQQQQQSITLENPLVRVARSERWRAYSFTNGCETLPNTLERYIRHKGADIHVEQPCTKLDFSKNDNDGTIQATSNSKTYTFDHVISTVPAQKLASLVRDTHPVLADSLNTIKCISMCTVNLRYEKRMMNTVGFGVLVPAIENLPVLGISFDSCIFPQASGDGSDGTRLTVMLGGYRFNEYFTNATTEEEFLQTAMKYVKLMLHIDAKPSQYQINILRDCIPQYHVGYWNELNSTENYIRTKKLPITVCGASYNGINLNSVVSGGQNSVRKLIENCNL